MFLLRIKDGDECGKGIGLHLGLGHRTYFVDGGNNLGGTPHNIERTYLPFNLVNKLECARFSTYLKIHDGPPCGEGHCTYFVDGGNNLGGDTAQH